MRAAGMDFQQMKSVRAAALDIGSKGRSATVTLFQSLLVNYFKLFRILILHSQQHTTILYGIKRDERHPVDP